MRRRRKAQNGKETREADKAAKRHAVKQTERNHVAFAKQPEKFREVLSPHHAGRVLGEHMKQHCHNRERNQCEAEDVVPAELLGEARAEKCREQCAGQTETGQAHRQSLKLRRIPTAGHRQRDDEARARDAQQKSDNEQTGERVRPQPA